MRRALPAAQGREGRPRRLRGPRGAGLGRAVIRSSGAEGAAFWLKEALPELADQIECHHASLDRDVRLEVEDRLKRGELRAVVCSTSLELGIDIGSVDLVVMLSTPKGVSRALQRTGRAGHNIKVTSRGLLMATNMNDLVECCATVLLARSRAWS